MHWPIVLFRQGSSEVIESVTQNLSSNGFCCHSETLFAPGEVLVCAIKFPSYDPSGHGRPGVLECRVHVERAEPDETGNFYRIACHIQDYRLLVGEENSRASNADGV